MKPRKVSEKNNIKENKPVLQTWILVLVMVQMVLILGLFLTVTNKKTSDTTDVSGIEEKITRMDAWFSGNVDGYGSGSITQPPSQTAPPSGQKVDVSADDDPWLGSENAKVTVIEFSDYQCPFCRKYWTESYPQLKKDFIDTGKIKYVYRDFPLNFHQSATPAAIAGNCVREQLGDEGYFKYHDIVFSEQNKQGQGTINFAEKDIFLWVEQTGGINMDEFNTCYNDPTQKEEVNADLSEGQLAGVSGTPSFFINGNLIVGAQPYSVIKAEIEKALVE